MIITLHSVEVQGPLGDCGDLLAYRLRDGNMRPLAGRPFGPLGHSYIAITCSVPQLPDELRAEFDRLRASAALDHFLALDQRPSLRYRAAVAFAWLFVLGWLAIAVLFALGVLDAG